MYCGPLLININPGPNHVKDYLNLQTWLNQSKNIPESRWKPHLYSFGHYVYQTMLTESKDQVINMLGGIGAGKTFNLVHLLEYFTYIGAQEDFQAQTFETIHKSIQLVHILGSILRDNNLESSSCGMLIRLGFNENGKISHFDLESKILDFTLPFSQNGRSFSILHALMTGASSSVKKMLELPENDYYLNFFKKFEQNFDGKLKEKFKLNDLEIWTRFHSLLKFFKFDKNEVLEILQLLSFILLCNEAAIGQKRTPRGDEYFIKKGHSSKKLAKMINMPEEEFLSKFGNFKDLNEIKNTLIALMKYSYYMIFEFCKNKVKNFSKQFFESINVLNSDQFNKNNSTENNLTEEKKQKTIKFSEEKGTDQTFSCKIRWINLLDFPGCVNDSTLGGLSTNLANECLNVYAGSQYLSVVDKLMDEKLNLKYFDYTHSYHVMKSLIGRSGLFNYLSQPFTEENFRSMQRKVKTENHFKKTTEFNENTEENSEFLFNLKFSHLNVDYNYESLYMESKSLIISNKLINIFTNSKNSIVKSTYKSILANENKKLFNFTLNTMKEFFKPLEGISPFVIYCLHSNNSLKIFFGDKSLEDREDWVIPLNLTVDMLKNSLAIPVLYWEWFGYHEWVETDKFVKEFFQDFEQIKQNILKKKMKNQSSNKNNKLSKLNNPNNLFNSNISLNELNPYEAANFILSVLGNSSQYILGANHVILKKGSLKELRKLVDRMLITAESNGNYGKRGATPITNSIVKTMRKTSENKPRSSSMLKNESYNQQQPTGRPTSTNLANVVSKERMSVASSSSLNGSNMMSKNSFRNSSSRLSMAKRSSVDSKLPNSSNSIKNKMSVISPSQSKRAYGSMIASSNNNLRANGSMVGSSNNNLRANGSMVGSSNNNLRANGSMVGSSNNNFERICNTNTESNANLPLRRGSMKVQCHLSIVEDIKLIAGGEINEENEEVAYVEQAKKVPNFNMAMSSIVQGGSLPTTSNNSPFLLFKLLNKINTQTFDSSFDEDNKDYLPSVDTTESKFDKYKKDNNIIVPQKNHFNVFKSLLDNPDNSNYDIFDYGDYVNEIIQIQNEYRAFRARKKYKIFRYIIRQIMTVQKIVRGRVTRKKFIKFKAAHNCIVFIQRVFRKRFERRRAAAIKIQSAWRAKKSYHLSLYKKMKFYMSDFEEAKVFDGNNNLEAELLNVSVRTGLGKFSRIGQKNRNSILNIEELEKEQDKQVIINSLLLEEACLNKDPNLHPYLLDKTGVSKTLKQSLKHHQMKQLKDRPKSNNEKIEDKLLRLGETLKIKKVEKRFEKLKEDEVSLVFKPNIENPNYNYKVTAPFLERVELFKTKQEKKLEMLKSKHPDPNEVEYSFKPELSDLAKSMRRNTDDLFKWKKKKEQELRKIQEEKEYKELIELEKNSMTYKINKNSDLIVKQKMEKTFKQKTLKGTTEENIKEEDEMFDLWPVQMEKKYFNK